MFKFMYTENSKYFLILSANNILLSLLLYENYHCNHLVYAIVLQYSNTIA